MVFFISSFSFSFMLNFQPNTIALAAFFSLEINKVGQRTTSDIFPKK